MSKFKFSFRKPEATSAARLSAFNKTNVARFFDIYQNILADKNYQSHQIFNVDETGCSTVSTKTPNVLSPTGQRRVIKVSSAERGSNVSVACCISAVGHYVPPFFIFPRVRMQPHFMNNAPPGSLGVCNESGWMNAETFIKWLEHFIKNVRPSEDNQVLLLMDNHSSHVTLQAVNLCRDHHISVLGFPPHTSHRMQPLDVAFYGPFKTAYSRACNDYLTQNPGNVINIKDIAGIFNVAYSRVATINNAVQGFKATGLVPLNSQVFHEFDFEPSLTTENSYNSPEASADNLKQASQTSFHASLTAESTAEASLSHERVPLATEGPELVELPLNGQQAGPSNAEPMFGLPPLPHAARKETKQRKKLPSMHITSTPVKNALEEKQAEKEAKEPKKEENKGKGKKRKRNPQKRKL